MHAVVELYCGFEKPFSKIAEALGYASTSVDPNPEAGATITSVIDEDVAVSLPSAPLIVWAAPPWSPVFDEKSAWATDGSFSPESRTAEEAIDHIRQAIRLITAINPTWWFLEHPKSLMRKMPLFAGFNRGYPSRNRRTIRHDEFGGSSSAESDIWTNAYWWIPRPGERDGSGGVDNGGRVPPFATAQMFEQLEQYRRTGAYGPRY